MKRLCLFFSVSLLFLFSSLSFSKNYDNANLTISVPVSPEAGLSNPQINVKGVNQSRTQTVPWGTQWQLSHLRSGTYSITASQVKNNIHTYGVPNSPISVQVSKNANTKVVLQYQLVNVSSGNMTIKLPIAPEAGLNNPKLTVIGMGQTLTQTVAFGTSWPLTNLAIGNYKVTSSTVTNGVSTYQANTPTATVAANSTVVVSPVYTKVSNTRPKAWDSIKHVVVVVFENSASADVMQQPYFKSLTTTGASFSQFFAISHPSEPNYLAMVGGSTFGVIDDSNHDINAKHLGDLLNAKGLSWKSYAEAYPGNCFKAAVSGTYYRKHEPFISFMNVQNTPSECAKIVPGAQFFTDVAANNLPTYSLYVPDINNDGHDTGLAYANNWLSTKFGSLLNNPSLLSNTLFIITFDEDDGSTNNKIYTVFVGAGVKPGAASAVHYTHYSVLRTIEDIFQLGTLGANDQNASDINDIWNL